MVTSTALASAEPIKRGDWCTLYMSTVVDYLSKPQAQWKDELKLMQGTGFSGDATFTAQTSTSMRAVISLPAAMPGTRVLQYVPKGGEMHAATMCEYKRVGKSWNTLEVVAREAFLSRPGQGDRGVQKRSFDQKHSDMRVFAVFMHSDMNAKAMLSVEAKAVEAKPIPALDASKPIPLVPYTKGSHIPANAVVELLQPTDKSERGPFAAWDNGKFMGIVPLYVVGGTKSAVLVQEKALRAYIAMIGAASKAGVSLTINSGFRDYPMQSYLYDCYVNNGKAGHKDCNHGNQAAEAGKSNHQSGEALDLEVGMGKGNASTKVSTWTPTYRWLVKNGRTFGFKRTVEGECWHWEYRPESAMQDGTYGSFAALSAEESKVLVAAK